MNLASFIEKWKKNIAKMNSSGIPIPMLRDTKTKVGSLTFSLTIVSAVIVIVGLIGNLSKLVGGVDVEHSLYFFALNIGLYLGRKVMAKDGKAVTDESNSR